MYYGSRRGYGPRRRGYFPVHIALLLILAALITGWIVGRIGAVGERLPLMLSVYRHDIDQTVQMSLDEYVKGVVAAEMPAEFHPEALKAQAVAARTLALGLWEGGQPLADHPDAIISTDFRTHQAWISQDELRERWGAFNYFLRWSKISRAVSATRGLVLTHNGALIYPAYHSSSGGHTEDSENYWTSFTPYLRGVEDPFVAGSRYERTEVEILKSEIERKVAGLQSPPGGDASGAALTARESEDTASYVEVLTRFPSGRVALVRVGDRQLTGRQLREALGLRSNWFYVTDMGEKVRFEVRGYGHGIGMSQYGADGMAKAGYTFDQILAHYYTGVEIVSWYD